MKKRTNWILVMIVVLALAGLACNAITGGGDEPTAVVNTGEGDPAATEAASTGGGEGGSEAGSGGSGTANGGEAAAPTLDLSPENNFGVPNDVNSFRIALDMQYEETKVDGTVESGRITATGAQVVEPYAATFDFTFEGSDDTLDFGGGGMSLTQIGDVTYVNLAGSSCFRTSGNEFENPFDEFISSETFLGGLQGATLVEENVTINGIQTNHYQFDETSIPEEQQSLGTLENVEGHVYVSKEEGYLVRVTMEADGRELNLGTGEVETAEGHIFYQLDYSDFNQPIEIMEPEGCGGDDSEYPMLADATDVNSFGDILSYNTATPFAEVVEFYKTEMVAAGYTLESEFASEPTALLTFNNADGDVTVSVVDNPSGEGLTVVITKG